MTVNQIDPWARHPDRHVTPDRRDNPVAVGGDLADVPSRERLEVWRRCVTLAADLEPVVRVTLLVVGVPMDHQGRRPGRPRADEERLVRGSWSSISWIAEHVGRSDGTVYRALRKAESAGWIRRVAICEEDGSRVGTLYVPGLPNGRLETGDDE